jgi:hypothetical protein
MVDEPWNEIYADAVEFVAAQSTGAIGRSSPQVRASLRALRDRSVG